MTKVKDEYEIIRGESSDQWYIGLIGEDDSSIAMDSNYTCELQVKANFKNDYLFKIDNFPKNQELTYFITELTTEQTRQLKKGDYYLFWRIKNEIDNFSKEFQAKLIVKETGFNNS